MHCCIKTVPYSKLPSRLKNLLSSMQPSWATEAIGISWQQLNLTQPSAFSLQIPRLVVGELGRITMNQNGQQMLLMGVSVANGVHVFSTTTDPSKTEPLMPSIALKTKPRIFPIVTQPVLL